MRTTANLNASGGFSLIEVMAALVIMAFGLLAAGQLMLVSVGAGSLARSKDTAASVAQDKLEFLSDLYRRDPNSTDLAPGAHGPQQFRVLNPTDGTTLNLCHVEWTVGNVADPRPGKSLRAKQIEVRVFPVLPSGDPNPKAWLNKSLTIAAILSSQTP